MNKVTKENHKYRIDIINLIPTITEQYSMLRDFMKTIFLRDDKSAQRYITESIKIEKGNI